MGRWRRLWPSNRQEETDLSEELNAHLAIEVRQRVEAGESPDEAVRAGRRAFGSATIIQEDIRESLGWAAAEGFGEDVRFGLRLRRKTAGWTTVVSTTLALG